MKLRRNLVAIFLLLITIQVHSQSKYEVSKPQPLEDYNFVLGTQAIGGKYKFTNSSYLVEQAKQVRSMGSNVLKISVSKAYAKVYPDMEKDPTIKTTLDLFKAKKDYQKVVDMDFKYVMMWVHTLTKAKWRKGLNKNDKEILYKEMYDFSTYLLKKYNNSGKTFMIGNWEGDWLLHGLGKRNVIPSDVRIKGMVDWFNIRQKAIDDAKRDTKHKNVELYHYIELNLAEKGMKGKRCISQSVLPKVDVDMVSYSSYEAIKRFKTYTALKNHLNKVMNYIEGKMKETDRKVPFTRRVFIGEYGYTMGKGEDVQCERSREVMLASLELNLPFALHWEMYNNEYEPNGKSKGMSLISEDGKKKAVYFLHQNYYITMNKFLKEYKAEHGKYPEQTVFNEKAVNVLKETQTVSALK